MKCHVCGSQMTSVVTDLPCKVSGTTIVILKGLPVFQCDNCNEFLLDDPVLERVEDILERADTTAELEVIRYAA
ncbi:MAG: type II toxin-antitoxin system MqsA family antitoxin [Thermodesulfobacteriota bacterium]|nr:type II toxin-antitoxin system MqsA family antitoxin [Thermodesulfobacteriota bacterium]